jgi:Zn-dependent protease
VETVRIIVLDLIALILSICVHEFGHAIVADKLGDPLPRSQGRVTLNPIAHIDPIGTLVMPVMQILFPGAPLLGWGKPVQVSLSARHMTRRFSIKTSHAFIAIAGPMMNLLFVLVLSGILLATLKLGQATFTDFLVQIITLNFVLAFFNLIPCPPLDGGAILRGILPRNLEWISDSLNQYGFVILFGLLATGLLSRIMWPAFYVTKLWLHVVGSLV